MASKIYHSEVYASDGCCGEYIEVTRRNGRIVARTVKLFTHGKNQFGPWWPATELDIERTRAPLAWRDEVARADWLRTE